MDTPCEIQRTPAFERDLRQLSKKYKGLTEAIDKELQRLASLPEPAGNRIPGLQGCPVYKVRATACGFGKRGGFRVIYYRAEHLLLALFVYFKGNKEDVHSSELAGALSAAGIPPFAG